jgi:hypothetical protein
LEWQKISYGFFAETPIGTFRLIRNEQNTFRCDLMTNRYVVWEGTESKSISESQAKTICSEYFTKKIQNSLC